MIHYQHRWSLIIWAKGVLRRNVGGDLCLKILSRIHLQCQVLVGYLKECSTALVCIVIGSMDYCQCLRRESWYTNLEQTAQKSFCATYTYTSRRTFTQQKTLTTHLFSLGLQPTVNITNKPERNAAITTHHPH